MNYKELIKETLAPVNIPVAFQVYRGSVDKYITFFCYNKQGELFAENTEIATGYYLQVDVWSKTDDCDVFTAQIEALMQTIGFQRNSAADFYESDTKIYHTAIRFNNIEILN
jgi:hypothetical protein